MKITITKPTEVEVETLHVSAEVSDWEDSSVDGVEDSEGTLTPCRNGDKWEPIIELHTGRIKNWEIGKTASIHFKVRDAGVYRLEDSAGRTVLEKDGYVPDCLCPSASGYGDYIIMYIDAEGFIQNWVPAFDYFTEDED